MRSRRTMAAPESEECLYCHGNSSSTGPCPMCGDFGFMSADVRRPDKIPLPKLDFRSKVQVNPVIAGV